MCKVSGPKLQPIIFWSIYDSICKTSVVRAVTKEGSRSDVSDPCLHTRSDLSEHVWVTVEAVYSDDCISVNKLFNQHAS